MLTDQPLTLSGTIHESDSPHQLSEKRLDRESAPSECALGVFVWKGTQNVDYYHTAQQLQASQGAARGGGGRGLVINAMTRARALDVMKGASSRAQALRIFGSSGKKVDLSEANNLEVIQFHTGGQDLDTLLDGIRSTGAKPLYVETIQTDPGALSLRTFRGTYGEMPLHKIPEAYVRVFVDNPTGERTTELEQRFNVSCPEPVVLSWSSITEERPGLLAFRMSGRDDEFDALFRPALSGLSATQFAMHSRFPTGESSTDVGNSQPQVQDNVWADHNGDMMNSYAIKQRLRDPRVHKYERLFLKFYGKPNVKPEKFQYRHIPSVDSAVVPRIHSYLLDCCLRHGIDPIVISLLEHPPSVTQIEVMPDRERHFFALARLAFPELSYQGSAATIVGTNEYIRITPDRTRVVWVAQDHEGNSYVASNGGAITTACSPENIRDIRPVQAGTILDIDLKTGAVVNRGLQFHLPGTSNGHPNSIFVPGGGFDALRLDELQMDKAPPHPPKIPFDKKNSLKIPPLLSSAFGQYGFKGVDLDRLITYANTGSYQATGLGNAEPDGVFGRATSVSDLSSEHKAFIVSPGRDYRIEFSGRMLLSNGDAEPLFLTSPVLFGSKTLTKDAQGKALISAIAQHCGTMSVDDFQNSHTLHATYSPTEKLSDALKRLANEALEAAKDDAVWHLVLDDEISDGQIPLPPDLACAVVHQALSNAGVNVDLGDGNTVSESLRSRVNIIGNFNGVRNAEEIKECILQGANAVCPRLALDACMGIFDQTVSDNLTEGKELLVQHGTNALLGMAEDLAIASGSSGFHDMMTLVGAAPGVEYETGIAPDYNDLLGQLPGMRIGGVDLPSLDLFLRSRLAQYGQTPVMQRKDFLRYEGKWERWSEPVLKLIKDMATQGSDFAFNPTDYLGVAPTTLEDLVEIEGFENFQDFPDEALRDINLTLLDFVATDIGHMSIGANNVETWLAMLAAVYELRHEAQAGAIPFLNEKETLIAAGIGEGGIAAEFRMFLMHIAGQYASGRFGITTNDGDIFDRSQLQKEGLLRIQNIQEGYFDESEITMLESLVAKLISSDHVLADLEAMETGKLKSLCRFITIIGVKNAQDAKRGYGGMLMKTIFLIAKIRGVTPHDAIKSFFNHPDGDSIEELRERIFCLMKEGGGEIPELGDEEVGISSKAASDPYAVANAFGEVKAGAVMRDLDWRGGTGNRPVGTKRASHPYLAVAKSMDALSREMLGLMTVNWVSSNLHPLDWCKKVLEGEVDGARLASTILGAMGCVFRTCRNCNTGMCGPKLTDQREPKREQLRIFNPEAPDDPITREDNVKTKKERAKRFLLAFIRTQKVLMKNLGVNNIEELKRVRGVLKIKQGIEVEGAEWVKAVTGHPYDEATVARACSVSARLDMDHLITREPFPATALAATLERYLALSTDKVSTPDCSRNAFLVMGDLINAFPELPSAERSIYMQFLKTSFERLQETYQQFLAETHSELEPSFNRDVLLARYASLNHLTDRRHQEFLERLITGDRIFELLSNFCEDGDEHKLRDLFFTRTFHSKRPETSIKSPRAIVSQQNLFTLDTYQGVQRNIAIGLLEHVQNNTSPSPFVFEWDGVLTDKDTGILSCLGAIAHHFPEEFHRTVSSIEIRLKRGVTGHNLGALINGDYLFGAGQGKQKLKIVVGSPEQPAHADGSVGISANGATIQVYGYVSDCAGACASNLDLSIRGASIKLGMGLKGNSQIYCHGVLPSVTGIGMTGNATILAAGVRRSGDMRKPVAKPGTVGGDMQGLSKVVLPASLTTIKQAQMLGVGTMAKKLSRLDEPQIEAMLALNYPAYENNAPPPEITREGWSKIVSEHYYRNLVTSLLVFDFYQMREDYSYEDQLESAAGEILERAGIDDRDPANSVLMQKLMQELSVMKENLMTSHASLVDHDNDTVFLAARQMALDFLENFNPESL